MRASSLHPIAQIRWVSAVLVLSALPAVTWAQKAPLPAPNQLPVEAPWVLTPPPPASRVDSAPIELQPANPNDSPAMRALILDVIKKNEADKKEAEEKKKKDEDKKKEEEGFRVGTDLKMTARWDNGLKFETINKDFIIHVGGRFQEDTVFFGESARLRGAGGIGDLQDGTFFRRVRIQMDGSIWEIVEFNLEYAVEQVTQGIPNLDEFWVGVTKVPVIGSIRVGHIKVPQGFEGDMVSSSKAMTFLERSAYTDAFYQNFAPGVWAGNSIFDQRMTWSAMWYREEAFQHGSTGADFGDGNYAFSGRLTFLPLWENEGRHMLHLGVSATYRAAQNPDDGTGGVVGPSTIRFRARPQIRDASGDFGNTIFGTPPTLLPGSTARMVDTTAFIANSATVIGSELFCVLGPLSFQSEWAWAMANGAIVGGVPQGTLGFNGGYMQVSYFLTGEHRLYDRRLGREGTTYIASPFTPFWATRDEGGGLTFGPGAWELAARFNYLNLNDGPIRGGVLTGLEVGVNWYLNTNVKCQFEYLNENRYHLRAGQVPGVVNGFATRVQVFF
jgi:phosphate-selective porin OprO and OprP